VEGFMRHLREKKEVEWAMQHECASKPRVVSWYVVLLSQCAVCARVDKVSADLKGGAAFSQRRTS